MVPRFVRPLLKELKKAGGHSAGRLEVGAAAGFGEHGGDLLLGELVDESRAGELRPVGPNR